VKKKKRIEAETKKNQTPEKFKKTKSEKTKKLRFIFEFWIKIYLRDEKEASTSFSPFFLFESPVSNR
jgi:hypothetical protein